MPFILGPQTREQDFSLYVSSLSKTSVGIVGTATRGEIGVPTFVTNANELINKFGPENPNCMGIYAALLFLTQGNRVYYSRIAGQSAKKAEVVVSNTDTSPLEAVKFTGKTPGTDFNGIKVVISNSADNTCDITVVNKKGIAIEAFRGVSTDSANSNFIEKLFKNSKHLDATYLLASPTTLAPGTYTLSGGDDGISDLKTSDWIGSAANKVGLESFRNKSIDINILIAPGATEPEVIYAGCSLAEQRGDCIFIADPPFGLSLQEVIDWHNGSGQYTHQAFNSSYGAMYWAWQEIFDSHNNLNVWVPPSGLVAAAYAYNDAVSEVWYAPAGLKRGLLPQVIRSEYNPDDAEALQLYTNGNCINPIIKHPTSGIAIFGQRTLQRYPSATDRVNVRRLLLYLRKVIASTVAYLTFEPNDRTTWNEFEDLVEPVLRNVKMKRGIYDYKVVMDSTVVTPEDIDEYQMPGRIYIQPTKAAEGIPIDFVLTRTGAYFVE